MRKQKKLFSGAVRLLIFVLGIYMLGYGVRTISIRGAFLAAAHLLSGAEFTLQKSAVRCLFPGFLYTAQAPEEETGWKNYVEENAWELLPLYGYVCSRKSYETEPESASVTELLEEKVREENGSRQEDLFAEMAEENQLAAQEAAYPQLPEPAAAGREYSREQLADYDFLLRTFYTVSPSAAVSSQLLNADLLLEKDMRLQRNASEPQILIYHTHSQENFIDSVEGDISTGIVGVGEELAEILRNKYGYNVIHNTNVYDCIDGKLDRNRAYALALPEVEAILAQYPSIEVVIDLHRDGVRKDMHLLTQINGKPTAQIMFFNGVSCSARNGPISYLENPYIEDNLAFSLQLQLAGEKYYPGLERRIYLKSLRYNLHVRPRSLLVEAGAQTNTREEMRNAMEPLADILYSVLGNPK